MRSMTHLSNNEDGALLVVCMLTLALLTFIGLSATQLSRLESTIAVNERTNKEALYASEFALALGESDVEHFLSRVDLYEETTPGHYGKGTEPAWYSLVWNGTDSQQITLGTLPPGLSRMAVLPRYTIAEKEFVDDSLARGIKVPTGVYNFTVTSRGTGSSSAAQVFLETVYAKRYN
jgi:Tfp pilus assembly protein PilX